MLPIPSSSLTMLFSGVFLDLAFFFMSVFVFPGMECRFIMTASAHHGFSYVAAAALRLWGVY
jgi:hypothetical protein